MLPYVAPYSTQNLVFTNLWNDRAYDLFCENSLTLLEKIVLTPLHLSVTVMRLKTNNVPFSAHGVMVYPLKKSLEARFLPWYDFSNLPFLVTTFRDKFGNINEGTVDMSNIVKAREFMTRLMIDPVYGKERYFYRFCNEVPFSNENMRMLADALSNPNKRSYPTQLRRLEQSEIHSRIDKPLRKPEFQNWIHSGYSYASIIWSKFQTMCLDKGWELTEDLFLSKINALKQSKNIDPYNSNKRTAPNENDIPENNDTPESNSVVCPSRQRRAPLWHKDYVVKK